MWKVLFYLNIPEDDLGLAVTCLVVTVYTVFPSKTPVSGLGKALEYFGTPLWISLLLQLPHTSIPACPKPPIPVILSCCSFLYNPFIPRVSSHKYGVPPRDSHSVSFSRGIFFVTKGTFGQLTCEWQYLFEEFTKEPIIIDRRRLRIEAKVQKPLPAV